MHFDLVLTAVMYLSAPMTSWLAFECSFNAVQVLLCQTSIQHLSILGRGEIDFSSGNVPSAPFEWGCVTYLTSLHVKTDWQAVIFIPAAMQLQSIELYVPGLSLLVESVHGWATSVNDLRIMCGHDKLLFIEIGPLQVSTSDANSRLHSYALALRSSCTISDAFDAMGKRIKCSGDAVDGGTVHGACTSGIMCMVLQGCRFDTGNDDAMSVYNGARQACSCGICWSCLQLE